MWVLSRPALSHPAFRSPRSVVHNDKLAPSGELIMFPHGLAQHPRRLSLAPLTLAFALFLAAAGREVRAQEEFETWHLEPGIGQAHLVLVARVVGVSSVTVVEGAKTDVTLREYRFQPIR